MGAALFVREMMWCRVYCKVDGREALWPGRLAKWWKEGSVIEVLRWMGERCYDMKGKVDRSEVLCIGGWWNGCEGGAVMWWRVSRWEPMCREVSDVFSRWLWWGTGVGRQALCNVQCSVDCLGTCNVWCPYKCSGTEIEQQTRIVGGGMKKEQHFSLCPN